MIGVIFSGSNSATVLKFWILIRLRSLSNLRIRLLFKIRKPSMQPKITSELFFLFDKTTQTPDTTGNQLTPGPGRVFQKCLTPGPGPKKAQNPAGVNSGSVATFADEDFCRIGNHCAMCGYNAQ